MKIQLPACAGLSTCVCLLTSACAVSMLLPGCVQVTNIGSMPASPVNVEARAKENKAEIQPVDYVKIQEMIRLSIDSALGGAGGEVGRAVGAISRPLDASPSTEMIDIQYNSEVGAGND